MFILSFLFGCGIAHKTWYHWLISFSPQPALADAVQRSQQERQSRQPQRATGTDRLRPSDASRKTREQRIANAVTRD